MENAIISLATAENADQVLSLYRSAIGLPGCVWNEFYPGMEEIEHDISLNALYTLRQDGRLIAAAAAGPFGELEDQPWALFDGFCELARVVVLPECRGQGVAAYLVSRVMEAAAERGWRSMRLLAAIGNPAAVALYEGLGFIRRGSVSAWGNEYYAYERLLKGTEPC